MSSADGSELLGQAEAFATNLESLLRATICADAVVSSTVYGNRVVVSSGPGDQDRAQLPLLVAGEPRLALSLKYLCDWDFSRRFLAIHTSGVVIHEGLRGNPLIRFEYAHERSWASSHIQLHAESSALGWVQAIAGSKKPPTVQNLHLPTGGRRFRPSLEDVVEFAVHDLGVEAVPGWQRVVEESRDAFMWLQLRSAIRDALKTNPQAAAELRAALSEAEADVDKRDSD